MAKKHTDLEIRERLAAWLRYYEEKYRHQYPTRNALAKALGGAGPHLTQIVNGQRSVGLDLLVRMHRTFHVSSDVLLDTDPPPAAAMGPSFASSEAEKNKGAA